MPINSKYFQTVCSRQEGTVNYQIVQPLGNPMILFSETNHTALCAFHLKCTTSDSAKTLIAKRPENLNEVNADFQGIIDTDNQEVSFVLTNLTDHYLSFSVKKGDRAINQINGLKAYDSYELACDQEDSKAFVLKTTTDASGQKVSVKQSEKEKTHEQLGSYLEVLFYPENVPALVGMFEKTVWKCVDLFWMIEMIKPDVAPVNDMIEPMFLGDIEPAYMSRRGQIEPMVYRSRSQEPGILDRIGSFLGLGGGRLESINQSSSLGGYMNESMGTEESGIVPMCACIPERSYIPTSCFVSKNTLIPESSAQRREVFYDRCGREVFYDSCEKITEETDEGETEEIDDEDDECFEERAEKIPQSAEILPEKIQSMSSSLSSANTLSAGFHDELRSMPKTVDELRPVCKSSNSYEQKEIKKLINQSKIGHLEKGKHIEVRSRSMAIDIAYKTPSVKCKISLSIHEGLVIKTPDQEKITKKAGKLLEALITGVEKALTVLFPQIKRTYKEGTCVICLCETPDTVIYQCGHQCCHFDCVKDKMQKCPLCRVIVGGFIKLKVEE